MACLTICLGRFILVNFNKTKGQTPRWIALALSKWVKKLQMEVKKQLKIQKVLGTNNGLIIAQFPICHKYWLNCNN